MQKGMGNEKLIDFDFIKFMKTYELQANIKIIMYECHWHLPLVWLAVITES